MRSFLRRAEWWLRRTRAWHWTAANARGAVYIGGDLVLLRTVYGHKMLVSTLDRSFTPHVILDAVWEPTFSRVVLREVKSGMRTLDIGAHVGWHTLLMCRQVGPAGRVYAFEPSPMAFSLLVANVQINAYHRIAECSSQALSDAADVMTLMEPVTEAGPWTSGSTLSKKTASDWAQNKGATSFTERTVAAVRLDDLAIGEVDFVKIDTDGSEDRVWQGGRKTLSSARSMLLEYAPGWLDDGVGMLREMTGLGFRPFVVEENGRVWRTDAEGAHAWALRHGLIYLLMRRRDY